MGKKYTDRDGFSLIEVIIAVAILAILSVPILLYFTNSAIHTARGRHEQSADIAAQTVIEEVDAVQGTDSIEKALLDLHNGWEDITEESDPPSEDRILSRSIRVDGDYNYYADVKVKYSAYSAATDTVKFNNYDTPSFQDLYSDSSVVISEKKDCFELGVRNLYNEFNGGTLESNQDPDNNDPDGGTFIAPNFSEKVSEEKIRDDIKRVFKLTVTPYDSETYMVKGSYVFKAAIDVDGVETTKSTEVVLKSTRAPKGTFGNIYFLFMPRYGNNEVTGTVDINAEKQTAVVEQDAIIDFPMFDSSEDAAKVNVSFIRQNIPLSGDADEDTVSKAANGLNYKIAIIPHREDGTGSHNYQWCNYYSDVEYNSETGAVVEDKPYVSLWGVNEGGDEGEFSRGLINRKKGKRIAEIEVNIYEAQIERDAEGNAVVDDFGTPNLIRTENLLATCTTSKFIY